MLLMERWSIFIVEVRFEGMQQQVEFRSKSQQRPILELEVRKEWFSAVLNI